MGGALNSHPHLLSLRIPSSDHSGRCLGAEPSSLSSSSLRNDPVPSQKLEFPPDTQSHLTPEDIQVQHLHPGTQQEEEELQKLSPQTPYYDLGASPAYCPLDSGLKDTDIYYAELDTSALRPVPGPRTTKPEPGEVVEYATIQLVLEPRPRMLPVFFGERIEVNPEPTREIRCNSEVRYASEQHFRDKVFYVPVPTVTAYSETVVAAPNCTWRSYRSQLRLEPRPRALRFASTTIIFPKHARRSFRTTLHCSLGPPGRRFAASVQLAQHEAPSPEGL
ncbi:PREDICTED: protein FAM101A-like [Elephantulus edwardii]|uniref:protein FAM101A-like n=1 Tax=Elephantulus edwardii TaxID=28737 RepID=UPI0003F0A2FE|nr:PREDICTED: protein FAM101A-like [Elephantulus edwardii]